MNRSSRDSDEEQDSLFGSPPPSPARGRSPSQETLVAGGETDPIIAVVRKNVGTIALPGSHMSCAELPANLPASSPSLPHPPSSYDSSRIVPPSGIAETPTSVYLSVATSRSSTCSVSSKASSTASSVPSASASTRKRRTPKSKSSTPIPPPIPLPGPNEPTPPNFLRSQSSLLGLAGVVGSVRPAHLHTHDRQPSRAQQTRLRSPIRGSTPTHPIVIDDDRDTPHLGNHPIDQVQMPQRLDRLNPELFRSNITNSLAKEKNLFPVLESLIKLLGGEPHLPPMHPPCQRFARPYGHGIFPPRSPPSLPLVALGGSASSVPPLKRRKLKHVPAGATDWDVPFPFAAGEGPEAYHDTWARDRAKQLVTQLLELVQNATKRAAVKTAKGGGDISEGRSRSRQSSRSTSVETQFERVSSAQANARESSLCTSPGADSAMIGTSMDSLGHCPGFLGSRTIDPPVSGGEDRANVDSEGAAREGRAGVVHDDSAFEEWLAQLQEFFPPQASAATSGSDWTTHPLDLSTCSPKSDILTPTQHATRHMAIDPALLAISQLSGLAPPPTSTLLGDTQQIPRVSPSPPALAHSPRTSLSSLTDPLTPHSEAFANPPPSTITRQDLIHDPAMHPSVKKDPPSRPANPLSFPTEPTWIPTARKGKARADGSVGSVVPPTSASSRSTPCPTPTPKGPPDKQTILDRARERRKQLAAEIERAKIEIWEATIENAVLVHLTKDRSL